MGERGCKEACCGHDACNQGNDGDRFISGRLFLRRHRLAPILMLGVDEGKLDHPATSCPGTSPGLASLMPTGTALWSARTNAVPPRSVMRASAITATWRSTAAVWA